MDWKRMKKCQRLSKRKKHTKNKIPSRFSRNCFSPVVQVGSNYSLSMYSEMNIKDTFINDVNCLSHIITWIPIRNQNK
jgi:hypothetical protein